MVDHYDSYTWNLVHLVASVTGRLPTVVEHDRVSVDDLAPYTHVVLSPGPGHPVGQGAGGTSDERVVEAHHLLALGSERHA